MAHLKFLEQFESSEGTFSTQSNVENLPGYDAGYAAGMAEAAEHQSALRASLIDQLEQARFTLAEAQQSLLANLAPFAHALCDVILPDVLDDVLRSKLAETLSLAMEEDIVQPITLTVHPSQEAAITHFLQQTPELELRLNCDPSLQAQEVLISTENRETQLNVPALIDQIRTTIATIMPPSEQEVAHG